MRHAYRKARTSTRYAPRFKAMLEASWDRLVDLSHAALDFLRDAFDIRTPLVRSSELGPCGREREMILDLCRAVGADTYLGGMGGSRAYLDVEPFAAAGVARDVARTTSIRATRNADRPVHPRPLGDRPAVQLRARRAATLLLGEPRGRSRANAACSWHEHVPAAAVTPLAARYAGQTVLAIGAHPDDLELAVGGTLARLSRHAARVVMAVVSIPATSNAAGGGEAGGRILGCELRVLSQGCSRIDDIKSYQLVGMLDALVHEFKPAAVMTHSANEFHRDHVAVHNACYSTQRLQAVRLLPLQPDDVPAGAGVVPSARLHRHERDHRAQDEGDRGARQPVRLARPGQRAVPRPRAPQRPHGRREIRRRPRRRPNAPRREVFSLVAVGPAFGVRTPPDADRVAVVWNRVEEPHRVCESLSGRKNFFNILGCSRWLEPAVEGGPRVCSIYAPGAAQ